MTHIYYGSHLKASFANCCRNRCCGRSPAYLIISHEGQLVEGLLERLLGGYDALTAGAVTQAAHCPQLVGVIAAQLLLLLCLQLLQFTVQLSQVFTIQPQLCFTILLRLR